MKKLILLLFIPLLFTCSSDSSDDNQSIREYLTTNVFEDVNPNNEELVFYEPLMQEDGLFRKYTIYDSDGIPCVGITELTYNDCYLLNSCYEQGLLISEDDEQIVYQSSNQTNYTYTFRRQGDDLLWIYSSNFGVEEQVFTLSSSEALDNAKATRNNQNCGCDAVWCN